MSKSKSLLLVLALVTLMFACVKPAANQSAPPQNNASPAATVPAQSTRDLQARIEQLVDFAKGRVGVAAELLETRAAVSVNAREQFPMQSVYKLPISMAVMKQVDAGKLKLDQKVQITKADYIGPNAHSPIREKYPNGAELSLTELIRFALSESDGTASDILMRLAGGAEAVQAYLTELGINKMDLVVLDPEMALAKDPSVQYRNYARPAAAIELLRSLHEKRGLSDSAQALILKCMVESTPGAKRLKGLLPAGTVVAHKTGTSGTEKGITAATNDIGIITLPDGRHLAIAVFVSESPADLDTRERVIAEIAKAAYEKFASN
nr:ClassA_beta_lactamase [uncultured bacterium]